MTAESLVISLLDDDDDVLIVIPEYRDVGVQTSPTYQNKCGCRKDLPPVCRCKARMPRSMQPFPPAVSFVRGKFILLHVVPKCEMCGNLTEEPYSHVSIRGFIGLPPISRLAAFVMENDDQSPNVLEQPPNLCKARRLVEAEEKKQHAQLTKQNADLMYRMDDKIKKIISNKPHQRSSKATKMFYHDLTEMTKKGGKHLHSEITKLGYCCKNNLWHKYRWIQYQLSSEALRLLKEMDCKGRIMRKRHPLGDLLKAAGDLEIENYSNAHKDDVVQISDLPEWRQELISNATDSLSEENNWYGWAVTIIAAPSTIDGCCKILETGPQTLNDAADGLVKLANQLGDSAPLTPILPTSRKRGRGRPAGSVSRDLVRGSPPTRGTPARRSNGSGRRGKTLTSSVKRSRRGAFARGCKRKQESSEHEDDESSS
eukprot:GHVL01022649.1.p2 GENE.GHVL01022649.1~~GHVL01022649.1.p2  ORF type:complete len:427 (+),score=61.19 GHVL01022649.1:110-1390(+)